MGSFIDFALLSLAASWLMCSVKAQFPPFSLCTEGTCEDCPQSVTSGGTGYPSCVVYNSDDVFASGNFAAGTSGGYDVYFDIAQPNSGCATIVKSPADTSVEGCGTTIGTFQNSACAELQIHDTFMVQFCCGTGDCTAAGVANAKRGESYQIDSATSLSGIFGSTLTHKNGSDIVPVQQGDMPAISRKRSSCVYTADSGMEEYTRPADNTQIMTNDAISGGQGGASVAISKSRTQEWSTSISAGVDISVVNT